MITPTKTYSSNPFVDNLIYYSKLMALNCSIKDEEEALKYETVESLRKGELYIGCIEHHTVYEMFPNIPESILEKYIAVQSNLDLYTKDPSNLKVYLNSLSNIDRKQLLSKISSLARTVYIDHYDVMRFYIQQVGPTWLEDNLDLYNRCKNATADYKDLFDVLPLQTVARIVKKYLNSHDYKELSSLWDEGHVYTLEEIIAIIPKNGVLPTYSELASRREERNKRSIILEDNDIMEDLSLSDATETEAVVHELLNEFQKYVNGRTDDGINQELDNISAAMRAVFVSHYEMMQERKYFSDEISKGLVEEPDGEDEDSAVNDMEEWMGYGHNMDMYNKCLEGTATYYDLYGIFPTNDLKECLSQILTSSVVEEYQLDTRGPEVLRSYFNNNDANSVLHIPALNKLMSEYYISNYQFYLNSDTYYRCKSGELDYFDLIPYLPTETQKSILATEIGEVTNLRVYSESKAMLNSYLQTLDQTTRAYIKDNINLDMQEWYPANHVETNNYYRALIGLPPLGDDGKPMIDTLQHSWDDITKSYKEFNQRFTSMVPVSLYPPSHWKQEIYKFDSYDIGILRERNVIEYYVYACGANTSDLRYRYLKYLGDDKLDLYTCRKAMNFQLIGIPTVDDASARETFVDHYVTNRDYVIRTVYSDAYKFQSEYYNKFIIIFILVNTIMDVLSGIPDLIINREVFDSRCIKYLFEGFGIPYYSEIPVKYQQAMLKNLNILIKYKSSTRNMIDICNLFGFSDIRVFGYYLMKDRSVDNNTGEYVFEEDNEIHYDIGDIYVRDDIDGTDVINGVSLSTSVPVEGELQPTGGIKYTKLQDYRYYDPNYYLKSITVQDENGNITTKSIINNERDLYVYNSEINAMIPIKQSDYFTKVKANLQPATVKFVRVPIDDQLTEYKNDSDNYVDYDETTLGEHTWDGELDHELLKQKIINYEFNAVKSKYISIETITEMTELSFQVSYFYNMLFDNFYSEESLTVEIPYIRAGHKFRFMDVICYLFAMMYYYNGLEDLIMYSPTQILYIKGYNYDEALNEMMNDPKAFSQEDEFGPLENYEKKNIFDINDRIAEDEYDYREAFKDYRIQSFNLEADIDELDRWLNEEYQMSLDDFIVDDSLNSFSQVITLRQFFSLKNSYYQKSIFRDNLLPLQYNNEIKYAFDFDLYTKEYANDINGNEHTYVTEKTNGRTYTMEVIDNYEDEIFVMDHQVYATNRLKEDHALYKLYRRAENCYVLVNNQYYISDGDGGYSLQFNNNLYVKDRENRYVFACSHIYKKGTETYVEVIEDRYFSVDELDHKIINFTQYYILNSAGEYVLDPDNCYIRISRNGVSSYVLLKNAGAYVNDKVSDDDCYILHSDGHFVQFSTTDYYIRTKKDDENFNHMMYREEELYVISNTETEYYDPSVTPRVYYRKLDDYYQENNYIIYKDVQYVKDDEGKYIPDTDLLSPTNCYYKEYGGDFRLIVDDFVTYAPYEHPRNVDYFLILQTNYDYWRLERKTASLDKVDSLLRRYIYDSDTDYILVLDKTAAYGNTNQMIVVLNKLVSIDEEQVEEDSKYNPSLHDNIWDENDWFYSDPGFDPSNDIGMMGENIWYYKKPGETQEETEEEEVQQSNVASGWYMDSSAYIGDIKLIKGEKYYISFDLQTNFSGDVQIYCEADPSVTTPDDRIYQLRMHEKKHIAQEFIAGDVQNPKLLLIKWDIENYPIYPGDYFVISDIRILKAYSENFIANDIPSYDKLQEIYRTNEAIYKYLVSLMINTSDKKMYQIYKKIFDSLMTAKYNKEAFKLGDGKYARTYTEFLEGRDEVLYERLNYFKSIDEDAMHKTIADNIIEVSYVIDDCVDTYSYGYLYSYFPAVSATYIQQYISKIINWFKSWKVQLLGINTVYRFNSAMENTIKPLEYKRPRIKFDPKETHVYVYDTMAINPLDGVNPSGIPYEDLYDFDDPTNTFDEHVRVRDRIRIISSTANMIEYDDNELHITLNDLDNVVVDDNNNLIISSTKNQFSVRDGNELIMTTDEDEQKAYSAQLIDEINVLSFDHEEFDQIDEELSDPNGHF